MQNDLDTQYCVIDHAGKLSDRQRANPNRLAKKKKAQRSQLAPGDSVAGGRKVSKRRTPTG